MCQPSVGEGRVGEIFCGKEIASRLVIAFLNYKLENGLPIKKEIKKLLISLWKTFRSLSNDSKSLFALLFILG